MVIVRLWRESWWVRSKRARAWPCAGYGKISICGAAFWAVTVAVAAEVVVDMTI